MEHSKAQDIIQIFKRFPFQYYISLPSNIVFINGSIVA